MSDTSVGTADTVSEMRWEERLLQCCSEWTGDVESGMNWQAARVACKIQVVLLGLRLANTFGSNLYAFQIAESTSDSHTVWPHPMQNPKRFPLQQALCLCRKNIQFCNGQDSEQEDGAHIEQQLHTSFPGTCNFIVPPQSLASKCISLVIILQGAMLP